MLPGQNLGFSCRSADWLANSWKLPNLADAFRAVLTLSRSTYMFTDLGRPLHGKMVDCQTASSRGALMSCSGLLRLSRQQTCTWIRDKVISKDGAG